MRINILRTLGTLVVAGLMAPAGILFAQGAYQPANNTSTSASWKDTATTSPMKTFSKIQDLSQKVRKEVGPLKIRTNGTQVTWKFHSARLARVKRQVNQMQNDVNRLSATKESLPSWQQQLLGNVKTNTHELVYQTRAAITTLNAYHNTNALATTRYPQYIDHISQRANSTAIRIGTVFQHHGYDMD